MLVFTKKTLNKLISFAPLYLRESRFSTLTIVKAKSRNKLNVKPTVRVSLTNSIEAKTDLMVKKHQDQGSHCVFFIFIPFKYTIIILLLR